MFHDPFTYIVGALILAWFLSLFGLDQNFIKGLEENGYQNRTKATYYLFFLVLAIVTGTILFLYDLFVSNKKPQFFLI